MLTFVSERQFVEAALGEHEQLPWMSRAAGASRREPDVIHLVTVQAFNPQRRQSLGAADHDHLTVVRRRVLQPVAFDESHVECLNITGCGGIWRRYML